MIVGNITTYDGHQSDQNVCDAHPNAQAFCIATKTIVTTEGYDTAPAGTQYHAGLQYANGHDWPYVFPIDEDRIKVIHKILPANLFVDHRIYKDGQKRTKNQYTRAA